MWIVDHSFRHPQKDLGFVRARLAYTCSIPRALSHAFSSLHNSCKIVV